MLPLDLATSLTAAADDVAHDATRHRVLIYYANETSAQAAASENYAALLKVLQRSASPLAKTAADSILLDARKMPALVQRDIAALTKQAERLGFDLAIFTNDLAFERRYLFHRAAQHITETRELPALPAAANIILATSPLARPDYFRAALMEVSRLYPKNSLEAVLIADSHGSGEMALIPRVNADLSRDNAARAMREMLESDDNGVPPDWARLQGIEKRRFWQILAEVGDGRGVRFPLVFREACASGLRSWAELFALPASVERIGHSAMGALEATDIDYATILGAARPGQDWPAVLAAGLSDAGIHVDGRPTLWLWVLLVNLGQLPPWLFFAPLLLWVGWYGWTLRRRRTVGSPGAARAP